MKHATAPGLTTISGLLSQIRIRKVLAEKKPGIFYRKGQAFLHFHEDKAGMFMDIRDGAEWLRLPAATAADYKKCLALLDRILG